MPFHRYEVHHFEECRARLGKERKSAYTVYEPGKDPQENISIPNLRSITELNDKEKDCVILVN